MAIESNKGNYSIRPGALSENPCLPLVSMTEYIELRYAGYGRKAPEDVMQMARRADIGRSELKVVR